MSTPAGGVVGDASIRVTADTTDADRAMRDFSRDAQGRLRDVRGRFVSASAAARTMGVSINAGANRGAVALNGVAQAAQGLAGAAASAAASVGTGAGGLGGALKGVGVLAGASLLPALGAVVPMMVGVGAAAGTLKLAFSGVGDAVALAGTDAEKYREALKKMGPEQRDFTKSVVGLKKEFGPIGKEIQKATLPGFTKAVKDAAPVVEILGKSMTEMGAGFGKAAEGVGRLMKDSGFQGDLQANLKLGNQFVQEMTGSLGPFTRSLLDFGAASGPTLTSFSNGLGGLLSKGLPSMFDGLKAGIPGTAQMLDGLFSMVNDALGAIGRFAGEAGRTLGPLFGQTFQAGGSAVAGALDTLRNALILARPLIKDFGFGLKTIRDVAAIVGPTAKDAGLAIAGAFLPVGDSVNKAVGPLQKLNIWVAENKIGILEGARVFSGAMITMTGAAINAAPMIIQSFKMVSQGVLTALDGIISGAAHAFGWVPEIGGKLKSANKAFDEFKSGYISSLDTAQKKASEFAASTAPKLASGKLQLNINNWQSQIEEAKAKLKTVPPSKQAALRATITDLQAKVRRAKGDLASLPSSKTVTITTNYVRNYLVGRSQHDIVGATGGLYTGRGFKYRGKGYAGGGLVNGPGTGTSDSVSAPWLSNKEFVVNAKETAKHLPLLRSINDGTLGMAAGGMTGAGGDVGAGLASGMTGAVGVVLAAARTMAAAVETGVRQELQISSPSRVTKALANDVGKGFITGLTASRDKIKSVAKDLSADIRAAFSGRKETGLVSMVTRETNELLALAAKRDAIAKRIGEANKFAADTANASRATGSLASIVEADAYSPQYVKGQMQASLNAIKAFTSNVAKLQKKGLNKDLLRQILEMGPEAGGAFAKSLAGADKATIKQYNSLNTQISAASSKLGKSGADMLYDSGKNAGKGLLAGLKSQQKDIEKLMLSIAKGMQSAIKKSLGIKSPSRVMDAVGRMTVIGLQGGIVRTMPAVRTAMSQVAATVASGIPASMSAVAAPGVSTPAVSSTRTSNRTAAVIQAGDLHLHVHNDGVIGSQIELDNWLTKSVDRLSRQRRLPAAVGGR
ncbi:hypothetical protein [Streptomyces sp. NBC_00620]|uniref:hypothetical protein n=1 Tax=Streptomyces sp. NBC_00620 TaxID=2903666 RepID=UPI00225BAEC5|nr:hypothetical protein [Streptomyces sp. NBC_00620]MCX4973155.1 hypothetical protein [Streptomyces sp. NBC_00620]